VLTHRSLAFKNRRAECERRQRRQP